MAIWTDPPIWPAHGRLWSHVISDTSLEELHAFAARVGIPERSFEGDHYDVPAERHADIVAAGAVLVEGRELVRKLHASGLRFRKRKGDRPLVRVRDGLPAVGSPHVLDVVASRNEPPPTAGAAVVLVGVPGDGMVLVRSVGRVIWTPPGGKRGPGEGLRGGAVRELQEETGLVVAEGALEPVGYERITIEAGTEVPPWDAGENHIAVYGTWLTARMPVAPAAEDVAEAGWFGYEEALERCGDQHWWVLVERWFTARAGR